MGLSSLPRELLFNIADRFTVIDDYYRFGRVCPSWKSIVDELVLNKMFMVIATPDDPQKSLYNISNGRIYDMELKLPKASCYVVGASYGWLMTLGLEPGRPDLFRLRLQSPFCNRIIPLPPLQRYPPGRDDHDRFRGGVWKAALSRAPSDDDDFVLMATINGSRDLAYYKPGNQTWTYLASGENPTKDIIDLIFFDKTQQFYALIDLQELIAVSFPSQGEPEITRVHHPIMIHKKDYDDFSHMHLVEDKYSGSLLKIHRQSDDFRVFQLDHLHRCWVRIDDIGENVLFMIGNTVTLRAASDCPGYEPNCICYSSPSKGSFIFKLEVGTSQERCLLPSEKMECTALLESFFG